MTTAAEFAKDVHEIQRVGTAFWNYSSEKESWLLVLAFTRYNTSGPLAMYAAVQQVVGKWPKFIRMEDVEVVSITDDLVRAVRKVKPSTELGLYPELFSLSYGETFIEWAIILWTKAPLTKAEYKERDRQATMKEQLRREKNPTFTG